MKNKKYIAITIISILMLNIGCANKNVGQIDNIVSNETIEVVNEDIDKKENSELEKIDEVVVINDAIDLQEVKPNELGQIMIIMYHSLGEKNSDYVRTVESFKSDMELLYMNDYRPISMEDYINNNISVEAGKTPFVLTFDDGHVTNFNIIEETNEIDPNSNVGILIDFNKQHPDFDLRGVFYLNGGYPFKQKDLVEYKLRFLLDNGFEIGNHSYGHENFKNTSRDKIEESLGKNKKNINLIVPDAQIQSLALPYGSRPANENDNDVLIRGNYEDVSYENTSILNVGWQPEYPSIHIKFNPYSINRVRAGDNEFEMVYWLNYFNENPKKRYISDGDLNIITIFENDIDLINQDIIKNKEIRTYILNEPEAN